MFFILFPLFIQMEKYMSIFTKIKVQVSFGGAQDKHCNHMLFSFHITQSRKLNLATFALYGCIKQSYIRSLLT